MGRHHTEAGALGDTGVLGGGRAEVDGVKRVIRIDHPQQINSFPLTSSTILSATFSTVSSTILAIFDSGIVGASCSVGHKLSSQ